MNTYRVTVYQATNWSILTQADHFTEHEFDSELSLFEFSQQLAKTGFKLGDKEWIMPGAILKVKKI